jgi:hypothetical protein
LLASEMVNIYIMLNLDQIGEKIAEQRKKLGLG